MKDINLVPLYYLYTVSVDSLYSLLVCVTFGFSLSAYRIPVFVDYFLVLPLSFLKKIFYDSHRERERQRHRQREKQAPCRKPDMGLDPVSPGSHPRLQAALNRCTTGAALSPSILNESLAE